MPSYNRVILIGHLTRDIELRQVGDGLSVAEVGLAVNDREKKNGEWTDVVSFFDVTIWGRTAEIASQYLGKGSAVQFEGKLKQDTWTDKETGKNRSKVKVIAERMVMLGNKNSDSQSQSKPLSMEDVPF